MANYIGNRFGKEDHDKLVRCNACSKDGGFPLAMMSLTFNAICRRTLRSGSIPMTRHRLHFWRK